MESTGHPKVGEWQHETGVDTFRCASRHARRYRRNAREASNAKQSPTQQIHSPLLRDGPLLYLLIDRVVHVEFPNSGIGARRRGCSICWLIGRGGDATSDGASRCVGSANRWPLDGGTRSNGGPLLGGDLAVASLAASDLCVHCAVRAPGIRPHPINCLPLCSRGTIGDGVLIAPVAHAAHHRWRYSCST
jgi:hypothetical protein